MDVIDDGGIVVLYKRCLWTMVTVVLLSYLHREAVEKGQMRTENGSSFGLGSGALSVDHLNDCINDSLIFLQ